MSNTSSDGFLGKPANYRNLYFYQKSVALYDITCAFTERYLQKGDRTIDQMVQAARSGKQNIVEGSEAGMTSSETEIKLLNVARASLQELREDFEDYLRSRHLIIWNEQHPRYQRMKTFCKKHNRTEDYKPWLADWDDEEISNVALTLIHQTDCLMIPYIKNLEQAFLATGGIREKMSAARRNRRGY
jgi:four helix bundle suffix protein